MRHPKALVLSLFAAACGEPTDPMPRGIFETPFGPSEMAYRIVDGMAIVEGDIALPLPDVEADLGLSHSELRSSALTRNHPRRRWKNGLVPYEIDPALPDPSRVLQAISEWNAQSTIEIAPRHGETAYVYFTTTNERLCFAAAGRLGAKQNVSLNADCGEREVLHEIGHALGLWHEQTRPDRDLYVDIHEENFSDADCASQFEKFNQGAASIGNDGEAFGPYELNSIMHYGSDICSNDGHLTPSVTTLAGDYIPRPEHLTQHDVCAVQKFNGLGRRSDINNDGYDDLVIGIPGYNYGTLGNDHGAISVLYGAADGLGQPNQTLYRELANVEEVGNIGDQLGYSVSVGDFNGDCSADIAVGVPYDDINGYEDAGSVQIFYGSPLGVQLSNDRTLHPSSPNAAGEPAAYDFFGQTLTSGDFNCDGYADLAVGIPSDSLNVSTIDSGSVTVFYGSATGLSGTGSQSWMQGGLLADSPEGNDQFGSALAAGDFNHDGCDELVIGAPNESVGTIANAGAIHIIKGTVGGLSGAGDQFFTQLTAGTNTPAYANDLFGFALTTGDFNADGVEDLAIGSPLKEVSTSADAGMVTIMYGSDTGITTTGAQRFYSDFGVVAGAGNPSETFGRALESDDFDGDGYEDLAVGVPFDTYPGAASSGSITILRGSYNGLTDVGSAAWTQSTGTMESACEASDEFGYRLRAGDFNGDGLVDLAVGVPFEDDTRTDVGGVQLMFGSTTGLTDAGNTLLTMESTGIAGTSASNRFGYGL